MFSLIYQVEVFQLIQAIAFSLHFDKFILQSRFVVAYTDRFRNLTLAFMIHFLCV